MATDYRPFWRRFRREAEAQYHALYLHNPGGEWNNNRHLVANPRENAAYVYHIYANEADVSLELHTRNQGVVECNRLFDLLEARRAEIEAAFGGQLTWERRPDDYRSFVRFSLYGGGFRDEERWPLIQRGMTVAMTRFIAAIDPVVGAVTATSSAARAV